MHPDKVYEDTYKIYIENMKIVVIKEGKETDICMPFSFNIKVQFLAFCKDLRFCFPGVTFDNIMRIQSYISPIILKFSNIDYNIIMMGIFHNISFDEGMD